MFRSPTTSTIALLTVSIACGGSMPVRESTRAPSVNDDAAETTSDEVEGVIVSGHRVTVEGKRISIVDPDGGRQTNAELILEMDERESYSVYQACQSD